MIKTIKNGGQKLELNIDWTLHTVTYKFRPITGVTMKLTPADIAAIKTALQPDFVALETRVTTNFTNMLTTEIAKVTNKIDDVETRLTNKIDNIVSKNSLVE